jgi:hypothetical protein
MGTSIDFGARDHPPVGSYNDASRMLDQTQRLKSRLGNRRNLSWVWETHMNGSKGGWETGPS